MQEIIAKRYIKALKKSIDTASLESVADIFASLANAFEDSAFKEVITSPIVSSEDKRDIILASIGGAKSSELNNFISLLAEKGRLDAIPAIADELKKELDKINKRYSGLIYSDSEIDKTTLEGISRGLSEKVDATIDLEFVKSDFDGIKVDVEGLGIEINFSKTRLNNQLIEHILKAI